MRKDVFFNMLPILEVCSNFFFKQQQQQKKAICISSLLV